MCVDLIEYAIPILVEMCKFVQAFAVALSTAAIMMLFMGAADAQYPHEVRSASGMTWHSYSFAGQDEFVVAQTMNKRNGTFVDVGSSYFDHGSNTYALERDYGWRGWCVDADLSKLAEYKGVRACEVLYAIIAPRSGVAVQFESADGSYSGEAVSYTVSQVLREAYVPKRVNYLSLSIQGREADVLNSYLLMDFQFDVITISRPTFEIATILSEYKYKYVKSRTASGRRPPPYDEAFYIYNPPRPKTNYSRIKSPLSSKSWKSTPKPKRKRRTAL